MSNLTPNQGRPLAPLAAAGFGLVGGLLLQFGLTRSGQSPFIPPYSVAFALAVIAAALIVFGLRLRRMIADPKRMVDPFYAVRVLVSARAGALVGALFGGFGGGSALSLIGRSVPAPVDTWLPMIATLAAGLALVICAIIAERWCRVPPSDNDATHAGEDGDTDPETQTAYRRP